MARAPAFLWRPFVLRHSLAGCSSGYAHGAGVLRGVLTVRIGQFLLLRLDPRLEVLGLPPGSGDPVLDVGHGGGDGLWGVGGRRQRSRRGADGEEVKESRTGGCGW